MVECQLPKLKVASSSLVARSIFHLLIFDLTVSKVKDTCVEIPKPSEIEDISGAKSIEGQPVERSPLLVHPCD